MNSKILWITNRSSIDNYAYPRCPFEVSMTPMRVDDFRPASFLITALPTVRGRAARKVLKGGKNSHTLYSFPSAWIQQVQNEIGWINE